MDKFIVKIRPVIVNGVAIAPGAACESEAEFSSAISAEMFLDDFDRDWKDNSVGDSSPTVGLGDGCLISAIIKKGSAVYSASVTKSKG